MSSSPLSPSDSAHSCYGCAPRCLLSPPPSRWRAYRRCLRLRPQLIPLGLATAVSLCGPLQRTWHPLLSRSAHSLKMMILSFCHQTSIHKKKSHHPALVFETLSHCFPLLLNRNCWLPQCLQREHNFSVVMILSYCIIILKKFLDCCCNLTS